METQIQDQDYDMKIFMNAMEGSQAPTTPFTKKEMINIVDNNSGNYQPGTITFETTSLANCGKYCDYANAYIAVPLVITLSGTDFATATNTDLVMALKNSNYNFIHSYRIEYDNGQVINNFDFANAYIEFQLNSESSLDDEEVNGDTIGYVKNKSTGWGFSSTPSANGLGLYNNNNLGVFNSLRSAGEANTSMYARQRKILNNSTLNKNLVRADAHIRSAGKNYIANLATCKTYYYNAIIRLKDLLFVGDLPLLKGAMMKIVLQMNIGSFQFSRVITTGVLNLDYATIQMTGGAGTNPVMVSSVGYSSPQTIGVNDGGIQAAPAGFVQCGSAGLPFAATTTYKVSFAVVRNHFDVFAGQQEHQEKQCRLYVPVYTMYSKFEENYLSQGSKRIFYKGVQYKGLLNKSSTFSELLTGGIVNPLRLIIVPVLNASGNQNINTCLSPFTCEPTYCSPYYIQNFNCQLASMPVYSQTASYDYETFLNEMDGRYSVTSNLERGITASRISLTDYQNTYGYIVVDLKRRLPSQSGTQISIGISGIITSTLPLDFHCFIEYEKEIVIDLYTGKVVATGSM